MQKNENNFMYSKKLIILIWTVLIFSNFNCGVPRQEKEIKFSYGKNKNWSTTIESGSSLFRQRKFKDGIAEFNRALKSAETPDEYACTFLWIANCYLKLGDLSTAIEFTKKAEKNKPDDIWLLFGTSGLFFQCSEYESAKNSFEKIVLIDKKGDYGKGAKKWIKYIKGIKPLPQLPDKTIIKDRINTGKILLVPVGEVQDFVLDYISEYIESIFGYAVNKSKSIKMPPDAYDSVKKQYSPMRIMWELETLSSTDIVHIIGITEADLKWEGGKGNFSWSWGCYGGGPQIISLNRIGLYGDVEMSRFLYRSLVITVKRIGNSFGIPNSKDKKSFMKQGWYIDDLDERKLELSPVENFYLNLYQEYERLLVQGDYINSIQILQEKIRQNPNDAVSHTLLGVCLFYREFQTKKFEQASYEFEKAMSICKNNPVALGWLGAIDEMSGKGSLSSAKCKSAVKENFSLPFVHAYFSKILFQRGKPKEAIFEYEQAIRLGAWIPDFEKIPPKIKEKILKEVDAHIDEIIKSFDNRPYFYSRLAVAKYLFKQKRYEESIKLLNEALNNAPPKGFFGDWRISWIYKELGNIHEEIKNYEVAIAMYKNAIATAKRKEEKAYAYNEIAWIYADGLNKNFAEALIYAKKAVDLKSKDASYLDTLAWLYFKLGDYEKSLRYIDKSLKTGSTFELDLRQQHKKEILDKLRKR